MPRWRGSGCVATAGGGWRRMELWSSLRCSSHMFLWDVVFKVTILDCATSRAEEKAICSGVQSDQSQEAAFVRNGRRAWDCGQMGRRSNSCLATYISHQHTVWSICSSCTALVIISRRSRSSAPEAGRWLVGRGCGCTLIHIILFAAISPSYTGSVVGGNFWVSERLWSNNRPCG